MLFSLAKKMVALLCLGLVVLEGRTQNMASYFIRMPSDLLPTVTVDSRKDLVDFYNNGKVAVMPSLLGGEVVLKALSQDYLLLQTSDRSDVQLKMLPVNDTSRIIVVVRTVAAPLRDSRVLFYSTQWKPLASLAFPTFSPMDFIDTQKAAALGLTDRLQEVCARHFVSCVFQPHSLNVVVHSSIRQDIRPEIRNVFEPVLKDSVVLFWDKGFFNIQSSVQ